MRVAICDDEKVFYNELHQYLDEYARKKRVDIVDIYFSCGSELITSELDFDLVFMDYQMGDLNGIDTARILRSKNNDVTIIFTTNFAHIVYDSFEVNTFRFLIKPIDKEKLYNALDDYLKTINTDLLLIFKTRDGNVKLKYSEIVYIESIGKHTILRTTKDVYNCSKYLLEVQQMLPVEKFTRCHRAYIVNFQHINRHDNQVIYLSNNERCNIGRKYLSEFKDKFQDYILRYNERDW